MATQFVAKHAANRLAQNYTSRGHNGNNPSHETGPHGHGRKTKKEHKQSPEGLDSTQRKSLKAVTRRARVLDASMNFCGIRVGWGAIVGIVPFLGDFFDSLMAVWVFREACEGLDHKTSEFNALSEEEKKRELHKDQKVKQKMMFNIVLDFFIGLVPFIGDVGDALFRANTMNAELLYNRLEEKGSLNNRVHTEAQRKAAAAARQNGVDEVQRPAPTKSKGANYLQRMNLFGSRDKTAEDLEQGQIGQTRDHSHRAATQRQ